MSFIQVTIHKMVTTVVDTNVSFPKMQIPEGQSLEDYIRSVGENDPSVLWQKAVIEAKSVVNEEIELLGVGEANTICHTCLAPIQVTGTADIRLDPSGFSYHNPTELVVTCSADPEHVILDQMSDSIKKVVLDDANQITSSTQDIPS